MGLCISYLKLATAATIARSTECNQDAMIDEYREVSKLNEVHVEVSDAPREYDRDYDDDELTKFKELEHRVQEVTAMAHEKLKLLAMMDKLMAEYDWSKYANMDRIYSTRMNA